MTNEGFKRTVSCGSGVLHYVCEFDRRSRILKMPHRTRRLWLVTSDVFPDTLYHCDGLRPCGFLGTDIKLRPEIVWSAMAADGSLSSGNNDWEFRAISRYPKICEIIVMYYASNDALSSLSVRASAFPRWCCYKTRTKTNKSFWKVLFFYFSTTSQILFFFYGESQSASTYTLTFGVHWSTLKKRSFTCLRDFIFVP